MFFFLTNIAYHLSEAGFDVWSGNARGNLYSKAHKTLLPNQKAFWDFSWHEIGYYDLPAMIDYILLHTQQQQINYIGHSQVNKVNKDKKSK
jgi:predicted alpha/beta hydrolase